MTRSEYETQEVVADAIVDCGVKVGHGHILMALDLAGELFVLARDQLVAAQQVNRTILRGGHQPGARVVRDSRL